MHVPGRACMTCMCSISSYPVHIVVQAPKDLALNVLYVALNFRVGLAVKTCTSAIRAGYCHWLRPGDAWLCWDAWLCNLHT
jgi:hypothetical protein